MCEHVLLANLYHTSQLVILVPMAAALVFVPIPSTFAGTLLT